MHCLNDTSMALDYSQQDSVFEMWREHFYRYCVQFGMPVFFYISGMSAIFFNFDKERAFFRFFTGKVRRLIIPMLFGIFFIMIPRYYVIQSWCWWGRIDNYQNTEYNYFKFMIAQLKEDFLGKLGPMWFLLFLFLLMNLNYPLIKWTSRRSRLIPVGREDGITILQQLLAVFFWDRFACSL